MANSMNKVIVKKCDVLFVSQKEAMGLILALKELSAMSAESFTLEWRKRLAPYKDAFIFYEDGGVEGVMFRLEKGRNEIVKAIQENGWPVAARKDLVYFTPPTLPNKKEGFMREIYGLIDNKAFSRMPERVKAVMGEKVCPPTLSKLRWEISRYTENPALPERERRILKDKWDRAEDALSLGQKIGGMKRALIWLFSTDDEHKLVRWAKGIEGYNLVDLVLNIPGYRKKSPPLES